MAPEQKFCEDCGKPLRAGVKFCEDCGSPVPLPEPPGQTTPAPSSGTGPGIRDQMPIAILPFVSQRRGVFSMDRCTLVVFPDRMIIAYVPKSRAKEMDQASDEVQAALRKKHLEGKQFWEPASGAGAALFRIARSAPGSHAAGALKEQQVLQAAGMSTRPWEVYLSMPPDAVLAEDPRNCAISRDSIGFIRGESDPSTDTDQMLISSSAGLTTLFFDFGTFNQARKALLSFLLPESGTPESMSGVIPFWREPGVKGFGFQYAWNLVVTDRRVIFCMIEDDFADEMAAWEETQRKQAKSAGRKWRDGDGAGRPDAPWQRFMEKPASELLENEVNFFLPLPCIRQVKIVPGGPGKADAIGLILPGGPLDLVFPEGTADHGRSVLEKVLPGRVF
jgi:hypothetical protein